MLKMIDSATISIQYIKKDDFTGSYKGMRYRLSKDKEMEMFRRFREFSKSNPNVTYEEFIKANM